MGELRSYDSGLYQATACVRCEKVASRGACCAKRWSSCDFIYCTCSCRSERICSIRKPSTRAATMLFLTILRFSRKSPSCLRPWIFDRYCLFSAGSSTSTSIFELCHCSSAAVLQEQRAPAGPPVLDGVVQRLRR